jgi:transketolase
MRDIFWDAVYLEAKKDKDIVIVSVDLGAPSLDKFREEMPAQFTNVGISEQNAVAVSAGLALSGKKVFAYGIAPFISMRCFEQTRVMLAMMNTPVTLVGAGAGFSYEESGPTHHMVEDLSILRILPHMTVYSPSCSAQAAWMGKYLCDPRGPGYIRLDRDEGGDFYDEKKTFERGFEILRPLRDLNLFVTGRVLNNVTDAAEILEKKGIETGLVDVYQIPCRAPGFADALKASKYVVTVEEHSLPGGFGSYTAEELVSKNPGARMLRKGLDFSDGYCYTYGGRDLMLAAYGLDVKSLAEDIAAFYEENIIREKGGC